MGNDTIVAGNGNNMIFGDAGVVLVPNATLDLPQGVNYAAAVQAFAQQLVDVQQAVGDLAYASVAALQTAVNQFAALSPTGSLKTPLNTLSIDNDTITAGSGGNLVVGDDGVITLSGADVRYASGQGEVNWVNGYDVTTVNVVQKSTALLIASGETQAWSSLQKAFPIIRLTGQTQLLFAEGRGYAARMDSDVIVAGPNSSAIGQSAAIDLDLETYDVTQSNRPSYKLTGGAGAVPRGFVVLDAGIGDDGIVDQISRGSFKGGQGNWYGFSGRSGDGYDLISIDELRQGDSVGHPNLSVFISADKLSTLVNPVFTALDRALVNETALAQQGPNEWLATGTYAAPQLAPVLTATGVTVYNNTVISLSSLFSANSVAPVTMYEVVDNTTGGGGLYVAGRLVAAGQPVFVSAANLSTVTFAAGKGTSDQLSIRATNGLGYGPWQTLAVGAVQAPVPVLTTHNASVANNTTVNLGSLVTATAVLPITTYQIVASTTGGGKLYVAGHLVAAGQVVSVTDLSTVTFVTGTSTTTQLSIRATVDNTNYGTWQNLTVSSVPASSASSTIVAAGSSTSTATKVAYSSEDDEAPAPQRLDADADADDAVLLNIGAFDGGDGVGSGPNAPITGLAIEAPTPEMLIRAIAASGIALKIDDASPGANATWLKVLCAQNDWVFDDATGTFALRPGAARPASIRLNAPATEEAPDASDRLIEAFATPAGAESDPAPWSIAGAMTKWRTWLTG